MAGDNGPISALFGHVGRDEITTFVSFGAESLAPSSDHDLELIESISMARKDPLTISDSTSATIVAMIGDITVDPLSEIHR